MFFAVGHLNGLFNVDLVLLYDELVEFTEALLLLHLLLVHLKMRLEQVGILLELLKTGKLLIDGLRIEVQRSALV